jgi:hypothetical protein
MMRLRERMMTAMAGARHEHEREDVILLLPFFFLAGAFVCRDWILGMEKLSSLYCTK